MRCVITFGVKISLSRRSKDVHSKISSEVICKLVQNMCKTNAHFHGWKTLNLSYNFRVFFKGFSRIHLFSCVMDFFKFNMLGFFIFSRYSLLLTVVKREKENISPNTVWKLRNLLFHKNYVKSTYLVLYQKYQR